MAYMLGNGLGKSRASRDASLRKPASWRLLFLSTGEISLAEKMAEDARNRRQTAGQQVRIIDLPSDTGNHGLFDNLHGFESAARLADHLRLHRPGFTERRSGSLSKPLRRSWIISRFPSKGVFNNSSRITALATIATGRSREVARGSV